MSSPLLMSASVLFMFVVYVHVLSSVAVNVSERGKYMVQILLILQCNADILIAPSSVPCCPPLPPGPPLLSPPLLLPFPSSSSPSNSLAWNATIPLDLFIFIYLVLYRGLKEQHACFFNIHFSPRCLVSQTLLVEVLFFFLLVVFF